MDLFFSRHSPPTIAANQCAKDMHYSVKSEELPCKCGLGPCEREKKEGKKKKAGEGRKHPGRDVLPSCIFLHSTEEGRYSTTTHAK